MCAPRRIFILSVTMYSAHIYVPGTKYTLRRVEIRVAPCVVRFAAFVIRGEIVVMQVSPWFNFFLLFFPIPFMNLALVFSLPPSRNSDPGSQSSLFSPPTHYGSCLAILSREDFRYFLPRRLASNCAYAHPRRSQQFLILFFSFSSFFANKFKISPRRDSNSRTNTNY